MLASRLLVLTRRAVLLACLAVLSSCGGGGSAAPADTSTMISPALPSTPAGVSTAVNVQGPVSPDAPNAPVVPAAAASWAILGVTTDDPNTRTADQVDALASLPRRAMVRVVLDQGTTPADYVDSVRKLAAVADVMALPLDSSDMAKIDATQAGARARSYMAALGDAAPVWEIGNEVNGNWVGSDPVGKIEAMFDAAKAYGRKTALTFYYENPATPGHDMLPWIDANFPAGHRVRSGVDYVLVSYYEDQNAGHQLTQQEIDTIFHGLAQRFPNAKVGLGEFGWGGKIPASDAVRADLIARMLAMRSTEPAFVGGGFYWHFRQTMSPKAKPDFALLRAAATR